MCRADACLFARVRPLTGRIGVPGRKQLSRFPSLPQLHLLQVRCRLNHARTTPARHAPFVHHRSDADLTRISLFAQRPGTVGEPTSPVYPFTQVNNTVDRTFAEGSVG